MKWDCICNSRYVLDHFSIIVFYWPVESLVTTGWLELNETEYESQYIEYEAEVTAEQVNWRVENCILVSVASQVRTTVQMF